MLPGLYVPTLGALGAPVSAGDGVLGGNAATDAAGVDAVGGALMPGMAKPPVAGAVELGGAGAPIGGIVKPLGKLAVDAGVALAKLLGAAAGVVPNKLGGVAVGAVAAPGCAKDATAGDWPGSG